MSRGTVLRRDVVHRGRVFELGVESVRLPDGREIGLDVIRHPGAAAILPLTDRGTILFLRQFRHAADGFLWEIPAGTLDPGETPLECAHRELAEEARVRASEMIPLGWILPVPGYSTERIHLFLARGLTAAEGRLDAAIVALPDRQQIRDLSITTHGAAFCLMDEQGLISPPMDYEWDGYGPMRETWQQQASLGQHI